MQTKKKDKPFMSYFNNIVLVKAEIEFFDVSFFEANISLCYLGAVIKNHVNSVSIPIDMRIDLDPFEKFDMHLKRMKDEGTNCDLVGISTMTASFPNSLELAKIAKKYGAYVVVGGYHPSAVFESVFESPDIDAVVRGEGEMTFKELVIKGPSKRVEGLSFRDEKGVIHHNPERNKIKNLDILPFPDRSLRPDNPIFNKHEVVVTSRGCNGVCTFCANNMVHGRWRGRSPENVVAELKILYNKNQNLMIHIWDANFLQEGERVAKIIELIKKNNIHFNYFCEMRVDHINKHPNIIKGLAEVGMEWIAIGIESPNQERLKRLKKGITTTAVEKAIKILKENKIKIVGYLMIGDPDETLEQTKEYPVYATKMGIEKIMLAIQTPHPGTQFFNELEQKGEITSYDWEKYDIGHSVAKLKHMTNHECELLMDWCWGKFYNPEWAFSQKKSLKEALYLIISFVWIGYPSFFIHGRPKESVEENLKAYISGMQGYYDLSKYEYIDDYNLKILKNCDFQLTFQFSDGDNISFVASIDNNKKLIFDIFEGKRRNMLLDFTLNATDYINIIKALPNQITSLVHWAGFNFSNFKANIQTFKTFSKMFVKAIRIDTIMYRKVLKYLVIAAKYLPQKTYELIQEELQTFKNNRKINIFQGNLSKNFKNLLKNLIYKFSMLPFTAVVPVG